MSKHSIRTMIMLIATFSLAGCYEVKEPIYSSGDSVPFIGTFTCSGIFGKPKVLKIEEKKSWFSRSTSLTLTDVKTNEVEPVIFKRLGHRIKIVQGRQVPQQAVYVMQTGPSKQYKTYSLLYVESSSKNIFMITAPDPTNSMRGRAGGNIRKFNVRSVEGNSAGVPMLIGNKNEIMAFVEDRARYATMPVATCVK